MRRRAFLGLLGGAAAAPLLPSLARADEPVKRTLPRAYVPYDARPYWHPLDLRRAHVDPLIWPAVKRINESGWVWTLESCQGHRGPDAWSDAPLIRLAVHHGEAHRMLGLLVRSAPWPEDIDESLDGAFLPDRHRVELYRHVRPPMPGWFEVRAVCRGPLALEVFDRFADAVNTGHVALREGG